MSKKVITKYVFSIDTWETLEEESYSYDGEWALCFGGGGGSKPDPQTYQGSIPPWAQEAHKTLLGKAEEFAYGEPYPFYEGERLAGFSPEEVAAQQSRVGMYEAGDPYGEFSAAQLQGAAGLPGALQDIQSGYQQRDFNFGEFGTDQANQYMSPFQQGVTDIALRQATDEFQRQKNQNRAARVSSGARGGYREALQEMMGGAQQGQAMADIQARGSQSAFENAQQQFERDRGAYIQAQQMGDQSAMHAAQQKMQADVGNRDAAFRAANLQTQLAGLGSTLGGQAQERELQRITEMERAGVTQREQAQKLLDLEYGEHTKQSRFPMEQMQFMSNMLSSTPTNFGQVTSTPGPSLGSQMMGLGMGAAGMSQLFGGQG